MATGSPGLAAPHRNGERHQSTPAAPGDLVSGVRHGRARPLTAHSVLFRPLEWTPGARRGTRPFGTVERYRVLRGQQTHAVTFL